MPSWRSTFRAAVSCLWHLTGPDGNSGSWAAGPSWQTRIYTVLRQAARTVDLQPRKTTKNDGLRHGRPMAYSTEFFAAGEDSNC